MMAEHTGVRLVIFDWAGTLVDHGSIAPVAALIKAFSQIGLDLPVGEARGPMGLNKLDHIRAVLRSPSVTNQWRTSFGHEPTDDDAKSIYARFLPLQMTEAIERTELIPGAVECCQALRARGIAIGTTTGYPIEIGHVIAAAARDQGFSADHYAFPDDVPAGRPAPWMIFRIMEATRVYPAAQVVKIGDTVPDIEEGRNAGTWTVGISETGSEVGLSRDECRALQEHEHARRLGLAATKLLAADAHSVVRSVAELPSLLVEIDAWLQQGKRP